MSEHWRQARRVQSCWDKTPWEAHRTCTLNKCITWFQRQTTFHFVTSIMLLVWKTNPDATKKYIYFNISSATNWPSWIRSNETIAQNDTCRQHGWHKSFWRGMKGGQRGSGTCYYEIKSGEDTQGEEEGAVESGSEFTSSRSVTNLQTLLASEQRAAWQKLAHSRDRLLKEPHHTPSTWPLDWN